MKYAVYLGQAKLAQKNEPKQVFRKKGKKMKEQKRKTICLRYVEVFSSVAET